MTSRELENLADRGQLRRTPATRRELARLLENGTVRLEDARNTTLAAESRFDLAYNAAHSLALAALRHAGYRSENRFTVFQALEHTAAFPSAKWRVLTKAHGARNLMEYEGEGEIDDRLLAEMILVTEELERVVTRLLR